jgi:hypothetical protein
MRCIHRCWPIDEQWQLLPTGTTGPQWMQLKIDKPQPIACSHLSKSISRLPGLGAVGDNRQ